MAAPTPQQIQDLRDAIRELNALSGKNYNNLLAGVANDAAQLSQTLDLVNTQLTKLKQTSGIYRDIFNETLDVRACNRGKRLSEEHKQRISESIKAKNIKRSDETKAKISQANKGHKHNLGRIQSEETKIKIAQTKIGKTFSEESKQKMREAALNRWNKK